MQLLFKKLIRHWKKILVPLVLVCFFLAVLWILWGFLPAAENDDGTFLVWQKTGTVLAAAGREGLLAYIVRVDDEGGEAGGQEGTHSRLALFLQELATHRGMCTCALAGAHPPAEILSKDLLEPGKPMEAAGIGMSLTPDGSGLWLSLFTNEGKSQAVFFDLEKKEGQTFSLPGRTVTGISPFFTGGAKTLLSRRREGREDLATDRNTDLPIEVFAMVRILLPLPPVFAPGCSPGDEEFLFLAPEERRRANLQAQSGRKQP